VGRSPGSGTRSASREDLRDNIAHVTLSVKDCALGLAAAPPQREGGDVATKMAPPVVHRETGLDEAGRGCR